MRTLASLTRRVFGGSGAEGAGRVLHPAAAPPALVPPARGEDGARGAEHFALQRETGRDTLRAEHAAPQAQLQYTSTHAAPPRARAVAARGRSALDEAAGSGAERATPESRRDGSPPRSCSPIRAPPALRASPRLAARGTAGATGGGAAGDDDEEDSEPGVPRSVAQLQRKYGAPILPPGMPTGPFATALQAKSEIGAFCMNPKTLGGGFAVVLGSSRPGVARAGPNQRGRRKKLVCHKHTQPHSCKWQLWLERCVEGWVIYRSAADAGHTHALVQSRAEANAHAAMRSIPEEVLPTAKSMVKSGMSVAAVERWLRHTVEARGDEVSFVYQDVYNATGASTAERALDATDLAEALRQREQGEGLFYRMKTDGEGRLSHVFFAMRGAHEVYAVDADHQVVQLDTKVCCCGADMWRCVALRCPPRLHTATSDTTPSASAPFLPFSTAPTTRG